MPEKEKYFNDPYFTELWTRYFVVADEIEKQKVRDEIVIESGKIALAVINTFKLYRFCDTDELMQEAYFKVLRDFELFNPTIEKKNKASAFIFLTTIIKNHLLAHIYRLRRIGALIYNETSNEYNVETLLDSLQDVKGNILVEEFLNSEHADMDKVFSKEVEVLRNFFVSSSLSEDYVSVLCKDDIGLDILDCIKLLSNINQKKKGLKTVKECMKKKGYREKDIYAYVKKVKNIVSKTSIEHKVRDENADR
jgi:hypothetical protein